MLDELELEHLENYYRFADSEVIDLITELRASRKELAELRDAADNLRLYVYGMVTASNGTLPMPTAHTLLLRVDQALGLVNVRNEEGK